MNELVFFTHLVVNTFFLLGSLKFSKKALLFFFVLETVLANLFVLKQITLFELTVTSSDVYMIGAVLALNLIQEYYGKALAKKAVMLSFLGLGLFLVMSQFHIWYLPSPVDTAAAAYSRILTAMPRLLIFSLLVFLIAQKIDLELYGYVKRKWPSSFFFRLGGVSLISQTVDTVLFSFLAFYGMLSNLWHVIGVSLVVKYALVISGASLVTFFKRIIKEPYEV